jgi:hypothetical protein
MMKAVFRIAVVCAVAFGLGGCAAVPLTTALAISAGVVGASGLALSGIHDCKQDGGCKKIQLPP